MVWKILLKYMPINKEKRESTINRKREEYANFVQMYCINVKDEDLDDAEKKIRKLIGDDVHRTQPDFPLFHEKSIQKMMIRILYVWHVRHPASGYVQGINDLLTPFLAAFFLDYIDVDYDTFQIPSDLNKKLGPDEIAKLEADTYWCLSKILDGILDNYRSPRKLTLSFMTICNQRRSNLLSSHSDGFSAYL
jgi:TBC1 domain family member 2